MAHPRIKRHGTNYKILNMLRRGDTIATSTFNNVLSMSTATIYHCLYELRREGYIDQPNYDGNRITKEGLKILAASDNHYDRR